MTGKTPPPDHAGVAFHPPILLAASIVLGFLLRWAVSPFEFLLRGAGAPAGPILVAASFGLFFWSVHTMRKGGGSIPTGTATEAIVSRGPYRVSRNPIYLSMLGLQVGLGVWANSFWFLMLAGVGLILLDWGVVSREERYLERKFGDEYRDYKARVGRWL